MDEWSPDVEAGGAIVRRSCPRLACTQVFHRKARKGRKGQPHLTRSKTDDCPRTFGTLPDVGSPDPEIWGGSLRALRSLRSNRNVRVYAKVTKEDKTRAADALAKAY